MTRHYEIAHIYDASPDRDPIFSCPREGTYGDLAPAGDEGGPNRVFIQGIHFRVRVPYRDVYTPQRVDDYVKVHLRFGHRFAPYLRLLQEHGIDMGDLKRSKSVLQSSQRLCE